MIMKMAKDLYTNHNIKSDMYNFTYFISVANYGLAGEYSVHTDAIEIYNDETTRTQKNNLRNTYYGDRAATVKKFKCNYNLQNDTYYLQT